MDRVRTRERTMLAWGLGAVALGALLSLIVPVWPNTDPRALLIFFLAALGLTVGGYRGALTASGRIDPYGPRVAGGGHQRAQDLTFDLGLLAFGVGVACWALLLLPWLSGRVQKSPSLGMWPGARFRTI